MIIKVERSGGFAGISIFNEIDGKDLPTEIVNVAKKFMKDQTSYALPMNTTHKSFADCYSYKISIQDGVHDKIIECSEFNIPEDLKLLVKYIERNSRITK